MGGEGLLQHQAQTTSEFKDMCVACWKLVFHVLKPNNKQAGEVGSLSKDKSRKGIGSPYKNKAAKGHRTCLPCSCSADPRLPVNHSAQTHVLER